MINDFCKCAYCGGTGVRLDKGTLEDDTRCLFCGMLATRAYTWPDTYAEFDGDRLTIFYDRSTLPEMGRIDIATYRKMCSQGIVPIQKIGGMWRIAHARPEKFRYMYINDAGCDSEISAFLSSAED